MNPNEAVKILVKMLESDISTVQAAAVLVGIYAIRNRQEVGEIYAVADVMRDEYVDLYDGVPYSVKMYDEVRHKIYRRAPTNEEK